MSKSATRVFRKYFLSMVWLNLQFGLAINVFKVLVAYYNILECSLQCKQNRCYLYNENTRWQFEADLANQNFLTLVNFVLAALKCLDVNMPIQLLHQKSTISLERHSERYCNILRISRCVEFVLLVWQIIFEEKTRIDMTLFLPFIPCMTNT